MSISPPQQTRHNDEIDLIDVAKTLWNHKWTLVITTLLFVIVALIASFLITPTYQLNVTLKPPLASQIASLDFTKSPIEFNESKNLRSFDVSQVFNLFYGNLRSNSIRQAFFEGYYWPKLITKTHVDISKENAYNALKYYLSIKKDDKTNIIDISIEGNNPKQLITWFYALVTLADIQSKKEIKQDIATQIESLRNSILATIDLKRSLAKADHKDRLVQLREAINVAKASNSGYSTNIVLSQTQDKLVLFDEPSAMYFRSAAALQAEVENINKRQSDDPFIHGLRQLLFSVDYYNNITVNVDDIALYRIDGQVSTPEGSISPDRSLLLIIALFLGLLMGCLIVFIRVQFKKNQDKI